ncbi:MAG: hypothetical protein AAF721_09610 [Myxococcota bacterium]
MRAWTLLVISMSLVAASSAPVAAAPTDADEEELEFLSFEIGDSCGPCCGYKSFAMWFKRGRPGTEALRRTLKSQEPKIRACFENTPDEHQVEMRYTVAADGTASRIRFSAPPTGADRCLARILRRVRFAPAKGAAPLAVEASYSSFGGVPPP